MVFILIPALMAMLLLMLFRCKKVNIPIFKTILIYMFLVGFGILSTYLLFFIENGTWGGCSLFGAMLFPPLFFIIIAKSLKILINEIMDFIAPSTIIMVAAMKANCIISGCCIGEIMHNSFVRFPSAVVETITIVLILPIILYLEYKGKWKHQLYPIALILYGISRFILNFFRLKGETTYFGISIGGIWSIIAVIFGALWIFVIAYIKIDKKYKEIKDKEMQKNEKNN